MINQKNSFTANIGTQFTANDIFYEDEDHP